MIDFIIGLFIGIISTIIVLGTVVYTTGKEIEKDTKEEDDDESNNN